MKKIILLSFILLSGCTKKNISTNIYHASSNADSVTFKATYSSIPKDLIAGIEMITAYTYSGVKMTGTFQTPNYGVNNTIVTLSFKCNVSDSIVIECSGGAWDSIINSYTAKPYYYQNFQLYNDTTKLFTGIDTALTVPHNIAVYNGLKKYKLL